MIVRLIRDVPVEDHHEMKKGNVYQRVKYDMGNVCWVHSHKTGAMVKLWSREYEVVSPEIFNLSSESLQYLKQLSEADIDEILTYFPKLDGIDYDHEPGFRAFEQLTGSKHEFDPSRDPSA